MVGVFWYKVQRGHTAPDKIKKNLLRKKKIKGITNICITNLDGKFHPDFKKKGTF